jgi:hypothetical protein
MSALESGDVEAARAAMAEHFTVGVGPLTAHLTERGVIGSVSEEQNAGPTLGRDAANGYAPPGCSG